MNAREVIKILEELESKLELVFVFETLMNLELRKTLIGRDVKYEIDSIPNYKEVTTNTKEGDNYHHIIPSAGDEIKGHLLYVTAKELEILDKWEDQYEKHEIELTSGKRAWVWLLEEEAMQDYGQNTSYELDKDDMSMMDYAKELHKSSEQ